MIEAMAARLAVIVSAVGNVPDVVVDGRDGLLVPAKDIVALTNALARVIDDPELRRELGNGGFTLAEREFSAEQAADRLVGAVNKAISCCDRMDRAHWG
jgi:glycosyltransferase involved in cell wall biosynthesis